MVLTDEQIKESIEKLKDDHLYYGEFGRNFLSNSDIGVLRNNPKEFGVKREDNKAFAEGRYFHQCFLEPEKAEATITIDVASRNTKAYKEKIAELDKTIILLEKEKEHIDGLVGIMRSNLRMFDMIYAEGNKYEQPKIGKTSEFEPQARWARPRWDELEQLSEAQFGERFAGSGIERADFEHFMSLVRTRGR